MLEEEGEDGVQGYQAVKGLGGGACGGRCSAMLEEEGEDGLQGYQAVRGAGRRGLWRKVPRFLLEEEGEDAGVLRH